MLNATHNGLDCFHGNRNHSQTSPNHSPIKSKHLKYDPAHLASFNHKTPPISVIDRSTPIAINRPLDDGPRPRSGSHGLRDFLHRLRRNGSSAFKGEDTSGCESPPLSVSVSPPNSNGLTILHIEGEIMRPRTQSDAITVSNRLRRRATTGQAESRSHRLQSTSAINDISDKVNQSAHTGSSIGPQEFVAMYRARAYSDTKRTQFEAARIKALANVRAQRVRTLSVGEESCTPRPRSYSTVGVANGHLGGANGYRGGSNGRVTGGSSNGTALSPLCNSGESKEPHLIIWCDPHSGTSVFRLPTISVDSSPSDKAPMKLGQESVGQVGVTREEESVAELNAYTTLLKSCRCYDIIPRRSKVVMLDSTLKAGSALFALIQSRLTSALVWDSSTSNILGLLTVTDFIRVLLNYNSNRPDHLTSIENETLVSLRHCALGVKGHENGGSQHEIPDSADLVHVTSDTSLYEAVVKLNSYPVSRLPVVTTETGDVIGDVTASSLLDLLHASEATPPPQTLKPIIELPVGTYGDNLVTVTEETPLLVALETLVTRRLSWLPVVDKERRPIGVYRKSAALNLALDESYCRVDKLTVGQVLTDGCRQFETCTSSDSLDSVFNKLVQTGSNRLVVINNQGRGHGTVEGVISASDVLYFLVLDKHTGAGTSNSSQTSSLLMGRHISSKNTSSDTASDAKRRMTEHGQQQ